MKFKFLSGEEYKKCMALREQLKEVIANINENDKDANFDENTELATILEYLAKGDAESQESTESLQTEIAGLKNQLEEKTATCTALMNENESLKGQNESLREQVANLQNLPVEPTAVAVADTQPVATEVDELAEFAKEHKGDYAAILEKIREDKQNENN